MAEGKRVVNIYTDWITTFDKLTDEEAGKLIKHFFRYVNDLNPEPENRFLELIFEPIKQQLKRDLQKWQSVCERNKANGLHGGRPKKNPKNPVGLLGTQNNPEEPKKPDKDKDTDKDKKSIDIPPFDVFLQHALSKKNVDRKSVQLKYEAWVENGWKDGHDQQIKNWKSKLNQTLIHMPELPKEKTIRYV